MSDMPEDPYSAKIRPGLLELLKEMAVCQNGENCSYDDRKYLAQWVAAEMVQHVGEIYGVVAVLYAHGDTLAALCILEKITQLAEEVLKPFFVSAGLTVVDPD